MNQKKPTISFFGSSLVSSYWNGAATYYRGILKYLHRLGYEITFYEPDAFDRQKHIDLPEPVFAGVEVYKNTLEGVEEAVRQGKKADVLIKASGVGVFDAFLERTLPEIRRPGQQVIFWDVDAPATLDSVIRNPEASFREVIPLYDYVLTYGGGKPVTDAYRSLGAKECTPVYNALDPETHYRVDPEPRFICDLAFLGNRLPDREERVMEFFFKTARLMPEKKFLLGGSGWDDVQLPFNVKYAGHVYTHEHNIFNSSARVVLNISRQSMADYGFSPATRVFEAAGAGACLITDYWEGIDQFFSPAKEILVARNAEEVSQILNDLDEEEIKKYGSRALAKVLNEHTYTRRARQVSQILLRQEAIL